MAFSKALYFAAVVPPSTIKEEVRQMKLEIKEKFGAAHALKLPAHITLIPPVWLENDQEKPFLEGIKTATENHLMFTVKLDGFGHFKQRVIFINVVDHKILKELHEKLYNALDDPLFGDKNKDIHPHITLATRDLSRENFGPAWQEFKARKYTAHFEATSLILFKHNGKTWDILETFPFSQNH